MIKAEVENGSFKNFEAHGTGEEILVDVECLIMEAIAIIDVKSNGKISFDSCVDELFKGLKEDKKIYAAVKGLVLAEHAKKADSINELTSLIKQIKKCLDVVTEKEEAEETKTKTIKINIDVEEEKESEEK